MLGVPNNPFDVFQSTFPRGERRFQVYDNKSQFTISIHVPAWGTTGSTAANAIGNIDFNPRSRVGNDWTLQVMRGGALVNFNPRSRVGNDCGKEGVYYG